MSQYDQSERVSPLRSYLELLRLPNIFTALADVAMGFLFVQLSWLEVEPDFLRPIEKWVLGLLLAASAMLYAAGVVLNDVFDVEIDRKERPDRPIPSGRVSLRAARWLGWELLAIGILLPWCATMVVRRMWPPDADVSALVQFRPGIVATLLAAMIVLYNAVLKRTPLGPVAMGACRTLNVLLGMSVLPAAWGAEHWLVAVAIGIYIAGVTWFARDESGESRPSRLTAALVVTLAGIGLLAMLPRQLDPTALRVDPVVWYVVMALVAARIVLRFSVAIADPRPAKVRSAVGQAILSLVVLDAVACFAVRGLFWGLAVVLLIVPATLISLWIEPS